MILSRMDVDKVGPFLLEVLCLIGLSMGTDNEFFQTNFRKSPWLFGEKAPLFSHVKSLKRAKIPKVALSLYS